MAKVRGSALFLVLAIGCLIGFASAEVYTVGDNGGWTFDVSSWPNGKKFYVGDTLVFTFPRGEHNVVQVNKEGYDSCTKMPENSPEFDSGNLQVSLAKGGNYFICTFPGHCEHGMKIAVPTAES